MPETEEKKLSAIEWFAKTWWEMYQALRAKGFTSDQSFALVSAYVRGLGSKS